MGSATCHFGQAVANGTRHLSNPGLSDMTVRDEADRGGVLQPMPHGLTAYVAAVAVPIGRASDRVIIPAGRNATATSLGMRVDGMR
jgi:hypothetical protein